MGEFSQVKMWKDVVRSERSAIEVRAREELLRIRKEVVEARCEGEGLRV